MTNKKKGRQQLTSKEHMELMQYLHETNLKKLILCEIIINNPPTIPIVKTQYILILELFSGLEPGEAGPVVRTSYT